MSLRTLVHKLSRVNIKDATPGNRNEQGNPSFVPPLYNPLPRPLGASTKRDYDGKYGGWGAAKRPNTNSNLAASPDRSWTSSEVGRATAVEEPGSAAESALKQASKDCPWEPYEPQPETDELKRFWAEREGEDKLYHSIDYCVNLTKLERKYGHFTTYSNAENFVERKLFSVKDAINVFVPGWNRTGKNAKYAEYFEKHEETGDIYMILKLYAYTSLGSYASIETKNPFCGFRGDTFGKMISEVLFRNARNNGDAVVTYVEKYVTKEDERGRVTRHKERIPADVLKEHAFGELLDEGIISLLGVQYHTPGKKVGSSDEEEESDEDYDEFVPSEDEEEEEDADEDEEEEGDEAGGSEEEDESEEENEDESEEQDYGVESAEQDYEDEDD